MIKGGTVKKLIILFSAIALMTTTGYAQSLSLGVTGGITTVQSPDAYTNDISDGGYGFGSSPHYGLKAKLGLPLLPLTVTGQLVYSNLSGEEGGIEMDQGLLIMGAGIEWGILPIPGPVNPYVAFDLFYSNFGELTSKVGSVENSVEGFSRTGIGIGAGVELTILPKIDLEASAKYNFNNLIGKVDGEDNINTINISASVLLNLN